MIRISLAEELGSHPASRLLHELLVLADALEDSICSKLNMNETDFQAIQHLIRHRSMTPGALAAELHISTAATTAVVDRLGDRGHLLRTPHPTDRRSFLIAPSPQAITQTLAVLHPLFLDAERVATALDDEGQKAVVHYLESLLQVMTEQIQNMDQSTTSQRNGRS